MHFVIFCTDKPDSMNVRMETRPRHVDYLKAHSDKIVAAGPTLGDTSEQPTGSLLIMEFETRAEAEEWAKNDPYAQAGLFSDDNHLALEKSLSRLSYGGLKYSWFLIP